MTQPVATATLATAPPVALVDRKILADALARVTRAVEKRNRIPILSNVRMVGTGESLIIEGTDLDVWSRVTLLAAADSRFAITAPAHMLRDVVKKASTEYVELAAGEIVKIGQGENVRDTQNVYLDFEGAKTALQALPVADWPMVENQAAANWHPAVATFTLAGATLRRMFSTCEMAISTEETRYYLNGIFMHVANGSAASSPKMFRAIATDGSRMVQATIAAVPSGGENLPGSIVPAKTVALVLAELKRKGAAESVEIRVGPEWISFAISGALIQSKLIDGTFSRLYSGYPDSKRQNRYGRRGRLRRHDRGSLANRQQARARGQAHL